MKNKNNKLNLTFRNNKLKLFPKSKFDIFNKSSFKYSEEALALFAQWATLGTPATDVRKTVVNNTIVALKNAGTWNELDCLYVWAAHSKLAACVDWKNPTTRSATLNSDYAGSFVTDNYTVSDGTFWIDTNYNPGNGGTYKFQRNDNSFGTYFKDHNNTAANVLDLSATIAANNGNELFITGGFALTGENNCAVNRAGANFNVSGLKTVKRTASNLWKFESNGYDLNSGSITYNPDASTAIPNLNFYQCCRNVNGTRSLFSRKRYCYTFFGSSSIDAFILNDIINRNYLTPLAINLSKRIMFNGNSFSASGAYIPRSLVNINQYSNLDINVRGISGQTTVQMQADAVNKVFNKNTTAYTKDILFVWELSNDMVANASNATTCYNNIVNYCIAARAALPSIKIVVATMIPRYNVVNANRQNDSNLLDDTTLNGKIRNHLVQDGYADAICDVASNSTMGFAGCELNTTYYNADKVHPTTTGYNYLADNYITSSINAFL